MAELDFNFGGRYLPGANAQEMIGHETDRFFAGWTPPASAGVRVSELNALTVPALFQGLQILSNDTASLPIDIYRLDGPNKSKELTHNLVRLLNDSASPDQSAFEWRFNSQWIATLFGRSYSAIEFVGGRPDALYPLDPRRVRKIKSNDGEIAYELTLDDGSQQTLFAYEVFELSAPMGVGILQAGRECLANAITMQEFQGRVLANGAIPSGAISLTKRLDPEATEALRRDWQALQGGASNAGRIAILQDYMSFQPFALTSQELQFIEGLKLSVEQIASMLNLSKARLNATQDSAVRSNLEQQAKEHVTSTLTPLCRRWEQEIQRKLLSDRERQTRSHCVRFDFRELLRGDSQARFSSYQVGIQNGILSPNDCRRMEDLPPVPGGDRYFAPLNMADGATGRPIGSDGADTADTAPNMQAFARAQVQQLQRLEGNAVKQSLTKSNPSDHRAKFYATFATKIRERLEPAGLQLPNLDEWVELAQLAADSVETADDLLEYARDQQERAEQLIKEIS